MLKILTVDPSAPEASEALTRYLAELEERFVGETHAHDEESSDHLDNFRPPNGTFVLLIDDGSTIGCGAIRRLDETTFEVKRMWVDPLERGKGHGLRLIGALEDLARYAGAQRLVLDTNDTLFEAVSLYERSGFGRIDRYNNNFDANCWFEKLL